MGHHHHGHPTAGQLTHGIQHLLDPFRIQCTGGFIKEHHLRVQCEGPGDRHPLLLAATELCRVLLCLLLNPHLLQQLQRPLLHLRLRTLLHLHRREGDVLEDREMGEQVELLKHHSHPTADRPHLRISMGGIQTHPKNIEGATIQPLESVEGADQGALARSGRTHHHQHLTAAHLQAHPIQSPHPRGVALHQVGGADGNSHRLERTGSSWTSRWRASRAIAVHASQ